MVHAHCISQHAVAGGLYGQVTASIVISVTESIPRADCCHVVDRTRVVVVVLQQQARYVGVAVPTESSLYDDLVRRRVFPQGLEHTAIPTKCLPHPIVILTILSPTFCSPRSGRWAPVYLKPVWRCNKRE